MDEFGYVGLGKKAVKMRLLVVKESKLTLFILTYLHEIGETLKATIETQITLEKTAFNIQVHRLSSALQLAIYNV